MNKPRLVALDVDGTLIDHDATLPDARVTALAALAAHDVPVVLVTGKIWPSIQDLWQRLRLGGPHVCCNGAAVVGGDGRPIALTCLPDATVAEVSAELQRRGIAHGLYLDDGTIVTPEPDERLQIVVDLGEPQPVPGHPDGRGVLKVLSVVAREEEDGLRGLAADRAQVQRTSHRFLEWMAPEVDKGRGLTRVAGTLGIDLADVVAVGDAENDLAMLAVAGTGVAVQGAAPAVVAAADVHLADRDLAEFLLALVQ